jgi:hypothetical protein
MASLWAAKLLDPSRTLTVGAGSDMTTETGTATVVPPARSLTVKVALYNPSPSDTHRLLAVNETEVPGLAIAKPLSGDMVSHAGTVDGITVNWFEVPMKNTGWVAPTPPAVWPFTKVKVGTVAGFRVMAAACTTLVPASANQRKDKSKERFFDMSRVLRPALEMLEHKSLIGTWYGLR